VLQRHGGRVEKFVGDAVMAVFGIPQAHENDALRAVRAAAELRSPQLRIGVNTGEVVTGEGETLVTGDAVNVAARLEQAAAPGEILIGAETRGLVRDAVETERGCRHEGESAADRGVPICTDAVEACVLARRGEVDEAERLAGDAVARIEETDFWESRSWLHTLLGEVLAGAGRIDEARAKFETAALICEEKGALPWVERARRLATGLDAAG
jgi:adenylate/guanylate cyclase family protein